VNISYKDRKKLKKLASLLLLSLLLLSFKNVMSQDGFELTFLDSVNYTYETGNYIYNFAMNDSAVFTQTPSRICGINTANPDSIYHSVVLGDYTWSARTLCVSGTILYVQEWEYIKAFDISEFPVIQPLSQIERINWIEEMENRCIEKDGFVYDMYINTENMHGGVNVYDFTDPQSPVQVTAIDMLGFPFDIKFYENYLVILVEFDVGQRILRMYNIENPYEPQLAGFSQMINTDAVYMALKEQYLYLLTGVSAYTMSVFDLSNPLELEPVDTVNSGEWDLYCVVSVQEDYLCVKSWDDIQILHLEDPLNPTYIGSAPFECNSFMIKDNIIYATVDSDLHTYRLDITNSVDEPINIIPETDIFLHRTYPNPFNGTTNLTFSINRVSNIEISIFDIIGRQVLTTDYGIMTPGQHDVSLRLDGSTGTYIVNLMTDNGTRISRKIQLIK